MRLTGAIGVPFSPAISLISHLDYTIGGYAIDSKAGVFPQRGEQPVRRPHHCDRRYAPWQMFSQQCCAAQKRLGSADLTWARLDTLVGASIAVRVARAMMFVGNDGFEYKILFQGPAQLALALVPITGNFVRDGVLLLMINAQAFGTTEISLAGAWASELMHGYHVLALAAVLDKLHGWSAGSSGQHSCCVPSERSLIKKCNRNWSAVDRPSSIHEMFTYAGDRAQHHGSYPS